MEQKKYSIDRCDKCCEKSTTTNPINFWTCKKCLENYKIKIAKTILKEYKKGCEYYGI